jgi:hypothetical protein
VSPYGWWLVVLCTVLCTPYWTLLTNPQVCRIPRQKHPLLKVTFKQVVSYRSFPGKPSARELLFSRSSLIGEAPWLLLVVRVGFIGRCHGRMAKEGAWSSPSRLFDTTRTCDSITSITAVRVEHGVEDMMQLVVVMINVLYSAYRSHLNGQFIRVSLSPSILSTMKLSPFALLAFAFSSVQADVELVVSNGEDPDGSGTNGVIIEWSGSLNISALTLEKSGDAPKLLTCFATNTYWYANGASPAFDEYFVPARIDKPGSPGVKLLDGIGFGDFVGMSDDGEDGISSIAVPANYTSGSSLTGQIFYADETFSFGNRNWTLSFESPDGNLTQRVLFRTEGSGVSLTPDLTMAPTPAPTSSSGCMMLGGVAGASIAISMLLV